MRISEDVGVQQFRMRAHLRVGVKPAAGVVQIDRAGRVEPPVLGGPQVVEGGGPGIGRIAGQESSVGGHRS